jgi:hypothetical protein
MHRGADADGEEENLREWVLRSLDHYNGLLASQ